MTEKEMRQKDIMYKMFNLDKAVEREKKRQKEEIEYSKLPRVYRVKPEDINQDKMSGKIIDNAKQKQSTTTLLPSRKRGKKR